MNLHGRVTLVTGASRGIGREVALAFGRAGASVALVARDQAALEAVAQEIGPERALVIAADLAEPAAPAAIVAATLARFGRIEVLVNNAGIAGDRDFLDTDAEWAARTVDVNLRAAVVLTRLAAEEMARRRGGHIVNLSSLAGVTGIPGEAVYSGTKAALRIFTASLRPELRPHGIRLTDVVLGTIGTDMLDAVESNPRVRRTFQRARRLGLLVNTPAPAVAAAIVEAVERNRDVVVLPRRARYLAMPLPGLSVTLIRLLSR